VGVKTSLLPDFYIGAQAAVGGDRVLTRDARRHRSSFPTLELIAPDRPLIAAPTRGHDCPKAGSGLDDLRVHALTTIGTARMDSGDDGGQDDLNWALELAVAVRSPEAGRAAHNLGVDAFLRGDIARFRELHAEGTGYDERFGNPVLARFSRGGLSSLAYLVGDWGEAQRAADAFLAECEAVPHYLEPHARTWRAMIRLSRDDVDGAVADIERALQLLEAQTDPQARAPSLAIASVVFLELGDPRALRAIPEVLEFRFNSQPEPVTLALLPLMDLPAAVEHRLREVLAEPETSTMWLEAARAAMDGRFADAAEVYARMPFRQAEALARVRAAEQLLAAGRRTEADEQLRQAIAFWSSVGATRYIRWAEKLLAATA